MVLFTGQGTYLVSLLLSEVFKVTVQNVHSHLQANRLEFNAFLVLFSHGSLRDFQTEELEIKVLLVRLIDIRKRMDGSMHL
jgi:hypothetical protein